MRRQLRPFLLALAVISGVGCGSSTTSTSTTKPPATSGAAAGAATSAASATGASQLLEAGAASTFLAAPPAGLSILDVRTPAEFAAGHLPSAIDVDLQGADWAAKVAALDPSKPYFVYCHSGNRSAQAVAYLHQHGFTTLYELRGGITAWTAAGLPTVTN